MIDFRWQIARAARQCRRIVGDGGYWLYVLTAVPFVTDLVETGGIPDTFRGWCTELVVGAIIALLVKKIHKDYLAAVSLARIDALTGLRNRRAFDEAIEIEWVRALRLGQPLSLVFIDLDNFKQVNDKFGHDAGDAVLRQVAAAIHHAVRAKVDCGFRLGGDEFAVLLPASDAGEAAAVVARIHAQCANSIRPTDSPVFSAGIVELGVDESMLQFLQRADTCMYRQKRLNNDFP